MDQQRLFWDDLVTSRRDARYIDYYLARTEVIDRCIKAFLAIAASASIGGWVVFQQYAFVWATIVALSQVLQAVKEYLPYKTRLKALTSLSPDLNAISLSAEKNWFNVSGGSLSDDAIHDLRFALKAQKQAALQKSFPSFGLPEKRRLADRADREAIEYFKNYLTQEEA